MIFWPHREVRIFGRRVPFTPGMFVARKREFAIAFSGALVERFCGPKDVIRGLGQALDAGLEERLRARLPPMFTMIIDVICFFENHDEPGGCFKKGFVPISVENFKIFQPGITHAAVIVLEFLFFCGFSDFLFNVRIADRTEDPGLFVGAGGSCSCGLNDVLNNFAFDGFIAEHA